MIASRKLREDVMLSTIARPRAAPPPEVAQIDALAAVHTILDVVCRMTGLGHSVVAHMTPEQWIACSVRDQIGFGLRSGDTLPADQTVCQQAVRSGKPVVITRTAGPPAGRLEALLDENGLGSCISVPIRLSDSTILGTLCAMDRRRVPIDRAGTVDMVCLFADLIAQHVESARRLQASTDDLRDERETAAAREEFIAVLGHDLRNPLTAVLCGLQTLTRQPLDARGRAIVEMMQRSLQRMGEMVGNTLDFVRGRLGGGITLHREPDVAIEAVLRHVVGELRQAWPARVIDTRFDLPPAIDCDRARIAQLFSNLLSNAITHGRPDRPVRIAGRVRDGALTVSVANACDPIPDAKLAQLFKPYVRGRSATASGGLGLGLHIAAEIARAHGGLITVTSRAAQTRFTLLMPLAAGGQAARCAEVIAGGDKPIAGGV